MIRALLDQAGGEHQRPTPPPPPKPPSPPAEWRRDGVVLPHGTRLRMTYAHQEYTAEIIDGLWMMNGEAMSSPSAAVWAAVKGTGNGWWYWFAQRPGRC